MLKRVLLGVDFSEYSENALRSILKSEPKPKEVVLVRVINVKRFRGADAILEKNTAEMKLSEIVNEFEKEGIKANYIIPIGNPAEEIVKVADSLNTSLIVLGHRGRGLLSKLLGSTTLDVIKSTNKPVLVIKNEQSDVFRKALFCYHPLVFNDEVKAYIEGLEFEEIVLLHVVEPLLPPEATREEMENRVRIVEDFLNDVKSKLECNVDVIVKIGDPSMVIMDTAKELNVSCIVLSTRVKRPILGGTTDHVLKHSPISVLVCREFLKRNDFIQSG